MADTLSREKDLSIVIGDVLPGVENTLVFKVIDDQTGVYALNKPTFTTVGKYSGGTLALAQNGWGNGFGYDRRKTGRRCTRIFIPWGIMAQKLGTASKRIFQNGS